MVHKIERRGPFYYKKKGGGRKRRGQSPAFLVNLSVESVSIPHPNLLQQHTPSF